MHTSIADKDNSAYKQRKWLLKNANTEIMEQFRSQSDMERLSKNAVQNTPTPCINIETAHSGLQHGLLSQEGRLLDSQFERLHFYCYDCYFKRKESRLQTGMETALDCVLTHVLTSNKGLLSILLGFQVKINKIHKTIDFILIHLDM